MINNYAKKNKKVNLIVPKQAKTLKFSTKKRKIQKKIFLWFIRPEKYSALGRMSAAAHRPGRSCLIMDRKEHRNHPAALPFP